MAALLGLRRVAEAVISPDGSQVACSVLAAACTDPPGGQQASLWIAAPGRPPRQVSRGPGLDALPRWSPDGQRLAFASDRDHPGLMSVYLLSPGVGEAVPAGDIAGSVEEISWSGDGQQLLVLAADPGSDRAGALTATRISSRDAPAADPAVTRPGQAWRRLYLVDVAGGGTREVGPDGENIWEFDWDGRGAAVAVVSADPTESSWYDATLACLDLGRRAVTARYRPRQQLAGPRLSPDGRRVAFVEGVASDRATWPGGTPKCAAVGPGELAAADLTAGFEVSWLCWQDAGHADLPPVGGAALRLRAADLRGRDHPAVVRPGDVSAAGAPHRFPAMRPAHVLASVREASNEPPEAAHPGPRRGPPRLAAGDRFQRRADGPGPAAVAGAALDRSRRRARPRTARPAARPAGPDLPLMVIVHGGPVSAWTHQWTNFGHPLLWTAAGYAVLLPNPRGSRGWGPEFAAAILGDMGGGELTDILSGVDSVVAAGIADTGRVGIFGASHGGYLTAWAITQTDRFAAAMPMACVSDWLSFHRTTNIGRFDELFVGADPYDAAGLYFQRSPVMHVRSVRTPTLIIHGALDLCTPVGQAQELYHGIAEAGQAEVELVIYPREGHGLAERAHQHDFWDRARAFFGRHLRVPPAAPPS